DGDFVVVGIGVRPRTGLAESAGLAIDRGVTVDGYLETSAPGVFAAGDIARWPDLRAAKPIRVEHWVVAERQGQAAARNTRGAREGVTAVAFFWGQHYDATISYVGHAEGWDEVSVEGGPSARDCLVRYKQAGQVLAVAAIGRDIDSLKVELEM